MTTTNNTEPAIEANNKAENNTSLRKEKKTRTPSSLGRAILHCIPMYLIVITLLVIALPKEVFYVMNGKNPSEYTPVSTEGPHNVLHSTKNPTSNSAQLQDSSILTVARLTLDSSKEKYDSIKDTYDKLFSVIAAIGALIAFLGFKGVDSFLTARNNAEETLLRAQEALETAEKALSQFKDFVENTYPKDNRAEINVMTGIVLRHIADSYRNVVSLCNPAHNLNSDENLKSYLECALYYLNAVDLQDGIDAKILTRTASTKGNIYKRLDRIDRAHELLKDFTIKHPNVNDDGIYFNLACYSCLLAKIASNNSQHHEAEKYIQQSLHYLRKSIAINDQNKAAAASDEDFEFMRSQNNQAYLAIIS